MLVFGRERWEIKGYDVPCCASGDCHGRALATEYALENDTGVVGLALGPRLAVAAPGAGVDIVVVVVACLELSSGRGDDKGTESEDGGESKAHDVLIGEERRGLAGWCSRVRLREGKYWFLSLNGKVGEAL